jgi:TolB protein
MTRLDIRKSLGLASALAAVFMLCFAVVLGAPSQGRSQDGEDDQPLPTRVVIDVDSPERALYRIAIPNPLGNTQMLGEKGVEVMRKDLRLISLFNVLNPDSFIADAESEGLGITEPPWSSVGAQGVVKTKVTLTGSQIQVEARFYELARGTQPLLSRSYSGDKSEQGKFMHDFANEIVGLLTGKKGAFDSRVTYARRLGPGRKSIYVADYNGHNRGRVSGGARLAMLPAFGPGGIWYSVLSDTGMFITNTSHGGKPVITGSGLNMGVTVCNGRAYFSSTRDGNSEIYSSNLDGSGVRRLTNHPAIDVSPTCGPGGQIAFVSSRHGGPQVFIMDSGGGGARRVTYKGNHNQTPAFCMDPKTPLLAFSGRDGGGFDIFTVNLNTGEYKRLTQGQGINQDPAFSPDCRMVAFSSSRGGMFISNPDGLNQQKVIPGAISTIKWSR